MRRKYRQGKRIESIADFEACESYWYIVMYGGKIKRTRHRSVLTSLQYHMLDLLIKAGYVYEAVMIADDISESQSEV